MRFSSLTLLACLLAAACGGNVVVDHGSASSGGATGTGGTIEPTTGSGNASSAGGAGTTSTGGVTTTSTGAGAAVPACASLGYVAVGKAVPCATEGEECAMPGTCCGVPLVCKNGHWAMTGLTCQQPCDPCGDGLGCSPNAICIEDDIKAIHTAFRCADNTCPNDTPNCPCDGELCTNESLMCIGPSGPAHLSCTDGTK